MMSMRSVLPFNDFSSERFSSKNIQGDQKKSLVLIRSLVLKILIDFCCKWRCGALLLLPPLGGGILSHLEAKGVFWGLRLLWPFPLPQSVSISFDFLTTAADSLTLSQAMYKTPTPKKAFETQNEAIHLWCSENLECTVCVHHWHSDLVTVLKSGF